MGTTNKKIVKRMKKRSEGNNFRSAAKKHCKCTPKVIVIERVTDGSKESSKQMLYGSAAESNPMATFSVGGRVSGNLTVV